MEKSVVHPFVQSRPGWIVNCVAPRCFHAKCTIFIVELCLHRMLVYGCRHFYQTITVALLSPFSINRSIPRPSEHSTVVEWHSFYGAVRLFSKIECCCWQEIGPNGWNKDHFTRLPSECFIKLRAGNLMGRTKASDDFFLIGGYMAHELSDASSR